MTSFVDVPWQQSAVALLLPAGNTAAAAAASRLMRIQLCRLHPIKRPPPWRLTLPQSLGHISNLLSTCSASQSPRARTTPCTSSELASKGHSKSQNDSYIHTYLYICICMKKAHTVCNSIKYSLTSFYKAKKYSTCMIVHDSYYRLMYKAGFY